MNKKELWVRMIRKGKTAEQLCATLGISRSTWSKKINGKAQFNQGEIVNLRRELELDDHQTALIFFDEEVS